MEVFLILIRHFVIAKKLGFQTAYNRLGVIPIFPMLVYYKKQLVLISKRKQKSVEFSKSRFSAILKYVIKQFSASAIQKIVEFAIEVIQ